MTVCLIVVAMLLAPLSGLGQASAQEFKDLSSRLRIGESLIVKDRADELTKGNLIDLANSRLSIATNRGIREFSTEQVREVWRRERDSLSNGMLIGLGIGVAAGLLAPAFSCGGFNDPECSAIVRLVFVPIGAGTGLTAGGLLDRAIRTPVLVYPSTGVRISFRF
jgi:hypothetical protein